MQTVTLVGRGEAGQTGQHYKNLALYDGAFHFSDKEGGGGQPGATCNIQNIAQYSPNVKKNNNHSQKYCVIHQLNIRSL